MTHLLFRLILRTCPLLLALCCWAVLPRVAWGLDAQDLFRKAQDSVVVVLALQDKEGQGNFGSGVLLQRGNLVATNHHIIAGAAELQVKLADGSTVKVLRVRAESPEHDLAILEIPRGGKPLPLARGEAQVGQEILAIGHPQGLERTLSTGVISGIRQKDSTRVYQITAPISPGSSGGPILNAKGEVLGLAAFYAVDGQNLNFAVPVSYIQELLGARQDGSRHLTPTSRLSIEKGSGEIRILQSK